MSSLAVLGEALIDLRRVAGAEQAGNARPAAYSYIAQPGGSPFNVAIGLARLGHRTEFAGRIAGDALGGILRRHAQRSGVRLEYCRTWPGPTPAALFELDPDGSARYEFHLGDADTSLFADSEAARVAASAPDAVHFGSIASWLPGSAEPVLDAIARLRERGVFVSYDPNIRGTLIPDQDSARKRVQDAVAHSDLIKASAEDLAWLYPELDPVDVAGRWLDAGASAVVVTHGSQGADLLTRRGGLHVASPAVEVVDTVGAGDAFMAGLLDGLAAASALGGRAAATRLMLSPDNARAVLDAACAHAAATCAVPGADPPWRVRPGSAASPVDAVSQVGT